METRSANQLVEVRSVRGFDLFLYEPLSSRSDLYVGTRLHFLSASHQPGACETISGDVID